MQNPIMADASRNWTDEELRAAVEAYVEMRRFVRAGKPFVKKAYYDRLVSRFGRTAKSYEYRMQNISYVYSLAGRTWVPGLVPARNVGANVVERIQGIIENVEGQRLGVRAGFEAEVNARRAKRITKPPMGNRSPAWRLAEVTEFERDPAIVAWVLQEAGDTCESCGEKAPFICDDGRPYLEVHHLVRLADGGPDTVDNAVGICPNCHRRLHYGRDRNDQLNRIAERVPRIRLDLPTEG